MGGDPRLNRPGASYRGQIVWRVSGRQSVGFLNYHWGNALIESGRRSKSDPVATTTRRIAMCLKTCTLSLLATLTFALVVAAGEVRGIVIKADEGKKELSIE